MLHRYLFSLFFLSMSMSAYAQNFASKTITQDDYKIIKETASSRTEEYVNFLSLLGMPDNPADEREEFIQSALDLMERKTTVVYNDLDPSGETTENFTVSDYLRNIPSFYPEGVAIFAENLQVSQVFYDSSKDRYFVKVVVTRMLEGNFKAEEEVSNAEKLDFYVKFYQGKEKSSTKIYLIDQHQDNLHNFKAVKIVEDTDAMSSLFSDEEKKRLKEEKKKALAENLELKDQLGSMSARLGEEERKRRDAERKARVALKKAEIAQQEADEVKNASTRLSKQLRAVLREEEELYDKASELVRDYDYLMAQKTVRNKIHRAGYESLRKFDKKSILYFNQIPTFKVLNQQPRWDAAESRRLQSRLIGIYEETQETMRSKHQVSLSKKYEKYQSKNQKFFMKLGYGMAAYTNEIEAIADGPIMMYNAQIAGRFAKRGNKRGTLAGLYGTFGQVSPSALASILQNPAPSLNFEGPDNLNFTEVELGFTIKEFWRISAGYGNVTVPTTLGNDEKLEYFPVTTGLSVSFFRFLEIDVFGSMFLGNDYIPMDTFRVGASANIIIKL